MGLFDTEEDYRRAYRQRQMAQMPQATNPYNQMARGFGQMALGLFGGVPEGDKGLARIQKRQEILQGVSQAESPYNYLTSAGKGIFNTDPEGALAIFKIAEGMKGETKDYKYGKAGLYNAAGQKGEVPTRSFGETIEYRINNKWDSNLPEGTTAFGDSSKGKDKGKLVPTWNIKTKQYTGLRPESEELFNQGFTTEKPEAKGKPSFAAVKAVIENDDGSYTQVPESFEQLEQGKDHPLSGTQWQGKSVLIVPANQGMKSQSRYYEPTSVKIDSNKYAERLAELNAADGNNYKTKQAATQAIKLLKSTDMTAGFLAPLAYELARVATAVGVNKGYVKEFLTDPVKSNVMIGKTADLVLEEMFQIKGPASDGDRKVVDRKVANISDPREAAIFKMQYAKNLSMYNDLYRNIWASDQSKKSQMQATKNILWMNRINMVKEVNNTNLFFFDEYQKFKKAFPEKTKGVTEKAYFEGFWNEY